jgi:glycosyltransferase involved in cell wall biosynthesis
MIRLLFVFDDCPSGQVATLLAARMRGLFQSGQISAEFAFSRERGARAALLPFGPIHLEPDPKRLRKLATARNYDAVIVIDAESSLDGLAGEPLSVPVIAELRHASNGMLERLERKNLRGVLVPSERMKERVGDHVFGDLRAKIKKIGDSADANIFSPDAADGDLSRPILLFRGELEEKEGWGTFLEIAALVSIRIPELELWMIGGEDAAEELWLAMLETAESLGVLRKLRWFGGFDQKASARALALTGKSGGAVFCVRRDETYPQLAAEALLAGCPVVAQRPTAISEFFPGANYVVSFAEDRYDEAERAVFLLLQDAARKIRRGALADRADIASRFAPETTGPAYLRAIRELLEMRSP